MGTAFSITPLELPEVCLVAGKRFGDERGFFSETFRQADFAELGLPEFRQHNHSRSERGVLRGLHFQINPSPLGKMVRCARGRIFDVAVDVRRGSPSFGRWVAEELSDEDNRMLWVPPGFAHGFLTLSELADVIYLQTDYWSPEHERSLRWDDPTVGIDWPLKDVKLSGRDEMAPGLDAIETNFDFSG